MRTAPGGLSLRSCGWRVGGTSSLPRTLGLRRAPQAQAPPAQNAPGGEKSVRLQRWLKFGRSNHESAAGGIGFNSQFVNGRRLGTARPFRCGAFIAARSHRPSINVRKTAPEHLELTIPDAMRRSVVTRNCYLQKNRRRKALTLTGVSSGRLICGMPRR